MSTYKRRSTTERGYGWAHQELRRRYSEMMARGQPFACARCGRPIVSGDLWDLGHDDYDRSRYTGPECRRCNRSAPSRRRRRVTSREW